MWMYKEDKAVSTHEGSRGNQILKVVSNVKPVQEQLNKKAEDLR